MSVEALCRRVTQFGFTMLEAEYALDARQHSIDRLSATKKSLMWVRNPLNSLMTGNPSRVGDYLAILQNQEYSYLMRDGGVLQIAYVFEGTSIERHRLSYHPCPFEITERDLRAFDGGLLDLIQNAFMDELEDNLLLRSPIRFDFAPTTAADFHPASHVTINDPSCRIPARSPLQFDTFMKLILENFYLDVWLNESVTRTLTFSQEPECRSPHDQGRAHLHWATR